jgi:hydrogenase nickel incorporation protein HypA/HybF
MLGCRIFPARLREKDAHKGGIMDEREMAAGLLEIIDQTAYKNSVRKVRKVHVALGARRHVDQALLQEDFAHAARNTVAEGAELKIEILPLRRHCQSCGETFEGEIRDLPCPKCGHPHTEPVSGEEARIVDMEVDPVGV